MIKKSQGIETVNQKSIDEYVKRETMSEKKQWTLKKDDYYFKCKDQTGHTLTSTKEDAMIFNSKGEAIDYNHKWLFGDYEYLNK